MARTPATLEGGTRISDFITLGVVARLFPAERVEAILKETGRTSQRHRDLPAHVVIYYVIALALFTQASCREVLRCLMEGLRWLQGAPDELHIAGKSAISQARSRLGWEPLLRLHDEIVRPIATPHTPGAWYRQWRIVSIDGSTLDVPEDPAIETEFGRPSAARGTSAYPQIRFVSLVESGTHVLFASRMEGFNTSEKSLAHQVLSSLTLGMLCLADRRFYGFEFWNKARATGAELLWRVNAKLGLPREEELEDGSYLSTLYPTREYRHPSKGIRVRVITYTLQGIPMPPDSEDETTYRHITTLLDPKIAPAVDLAALYPERWEIESAFDELKTHLRGRQMLLRSKTPDLIRQEFYGLMMAHFAIRGLMHEAALQAKLDPDRLSFIHAVRVIRRTSRLSPPSPTPDRPHHHPPGAPERTGQLQPKPLQPPGRQA